MKSAWVTATGKRKREWEQKGEGRKVREGTKRGEEGEGRRIGREEKYHSEALSSREVDHART